MELIDIITNKKNIKENRYTVLAPRNNWDMNFHFIDLLDNLDYLIDIDSIQDNENELDEYGGILRTDLFDMLDIELIIDNSWKKVPFNY